MGISDFIGKSSKKPPQKDGRTSGSSSSQHSGKPQVTMIAPGGGAFNVPPGTCPLDPSKKCPQSCPGFPVPGMCHNVP